MSLNIKNDVPINRPSPLPSKGAKQEDELSIHTVVALLSSVPLIDENQEISDTDGARFQQAMLMLLTLSQKLQIVLGDLAKLQDDQISNNSRSILEQVIKTGQAVQNKFKEAIEKEAEAKKAQEAMSIFGWLLGALAVVLAVLTGGLLAGLVAGALVVLQNVDVGGGSVMQHFEKELEKVMPTWAAQLMVSLTTIVAGCAGAIASVAESALMTGSQAAAETAAKTTAQKIMDSISKTILMNVTSSVMSSGLLETALTASLDGIFGPDNECSDAIKQLKTSLKIIIQFLVMLAAALKSAKAAQGNEAPGIFSDLTENGAKILDQLKKGVIISEMAGGVGSSAAQVAEGAYQLEQGKAYLEMANSKGAQNILDMIQKLFTGLMDGRHDKFLQEMDALVKGLNKIMKTFNIFEFHAKILGDI